jgi:tripartite-type tricarboxylate transporter receptor subunit TctC
MITRRRFIEGSASVILGSGIITRALGDSNIPAGRLLYGYPPGASGSRLAGVLLPLLVAEGGPNYSLINVEGRSTRAASITAALAPSDGTVLLQAISTSLTLMPSVYRELGFDPFKDFKPIASLGDFPYVLVVGPAVPKSVINLASYLEWVKANPDFRNIGTAVNGSLGQLAVMSLINITGESLRSQSYQGTEALFSDLKNQTLAAALVVPNPTISPQPESAFRPIGTTAGERFPYWPSILPLAEQGVSGMDITGWFGWFTQSKTPESALLALRQGVKKMQASPLYAEALRHALLISNVFTPQEITVRMHKEFDRYHDLVGKLRIEKIQ